MIKLSTPQEYADFISFHFISFSPIGLIHFWANWNNYDLQMKNRLKKLEVFYSQIVQFGLVDTDQESMFSICHKEKIINLPALIYYKNSEHIGTEIGLTQPIEEMEILLNILKLNKSGFSMINVKNDQPLHLFCLFTFAGCQKIILV